ncbi:MAG TPA: hypothetical protein VM582_08205 [Candidatus Thermoplasmatota archaeon]|nr:hypothetical protein [Candidatus Thermoplasmatota archaeon]
MDEETWARVAMERAVAEREHEDALELLEALRRGRADDALLAGAQARVRDAEARLREATSKYRLAEALRARAHAREP